MNGPYPSIEDPTTDGGQATATVGGGASQPGPGGPTSSPAPATAQDGSYSNPDADLEDMKRDSWGARVYHGVLSALGGGGDVQYSRDPKTGQMTATPVKSGPGSQWKRIISGALTGFSAAAAAQGTGPGSTLRAAGAGTAAGINAAKERRQQGINEANQDFEGQQKAAMQNAQVALLTHQVAKATFDLGRDQIDASVQDSDRESNFEKVISDGGEGTYDMGVFPDFDSVMKAFKEVPELHGHQAGGRIIAIPHINDNGKVDGLRAALVTPDWLNAKVNRDLPITTRTFRDGKVEEQTFTIPVGSLTGQQYAQMVMAQSKDATDDWTKTQDVNIKADAEKSEEPLKKGLTAQAFAAADKDKAESLLDQAKAAAADTDVDWGPGGQKGFNIWHDKNVTPALQAERNYRLSSQVYNEYQDLRKQGKDFPSGAQSVQMLSNHIANTFGNVKGARITKDMIEKHLGARGVSDSARVAIQRLSDGDVLSPSQWDAYFSLIGQTRQETWRGVLEDAQALGRPVDYIAFPQDLRERWGLGAGRVSLDQPRQQKGGQQQLPSSSTPPTGATHKAPGTGANAGTTYWTDDKGKVLGVVAP